MRFPLLVLVACGSSNAPPPTKDQRIEAALARVEGITPRLAKVRELPVKQPIPTARQSSADFRTFLQSEIARELPKDKSAKLSEAYLHIGLLAKRADLGSALEQTMASQAAAYYDPKAKKFFVVMIPDNDLMLDGMSAHELTHGLQDQAFDLGKYLVTDPPLDDDAQVARQFVVEGDATVAMSMYMAVEGGALGTKAILRQVRPQIELMANMDLAGYSMAMQQQAAAIKDLDADFKKAIDAIGDLPPMLVWPLLDSYNRGALVVLAAIDHGGWAAVDALYKTPPTSSEQVLHPTTKLIPKREEPIRVTLPALEGELLASNVLGEIQWRTYFSLWAPGSTAASEGWGGDRYAVVKRADGSLLGYHATVWDTAADAKQFADAYRASLAKRFPKHDRKHAISATDTKVFILDGSDDAALLAKLVEGTSL